MGAQEEAVAQLERLIMENVNFWDDEPGSAPRAILEAGWRPTRVIRTADELDQLHHTFCVIREIPSDPLDFYPQIWEMAMQAGWCRAGRMFDPDDCTPQLPVLVLLEGLDDDGSR